MLKRAISVVALMIALPTDAQELPAGYSAVGAESETLLPVGLPEEGDHKKIAEALAEAEDSGEQALQLIRAVLEAAAVEHLPEGTKVRVEEALTRYLLPLPVGQEAENVVGYSALSKLRPQNTDYSRRECPVFCVWLIGSMLPERSKDDDDFQRTAGRAAEGLQAA